MTPGTKLGPYEIVALIGAGGMGEVYRAKDTKLKRDVALKVLPEAFASDPERMARFQREAEVLASLNHPNIAQIYGVEERALVMELVEGESPKGPMAFEEAWKIAAQIAAGLEYAHEKGIVHRDLKPANIKITPDGIVKLLDFGLAKAFTRQGAASGNSENSPTLTLGATQLGVILGTAAYMAPEQAKGKAVDKRADIWSFGVVLYELLTGARLFSGEDVSDILALVLTKQPDLDKVPFQAHRLLRECLQKDPKERLRDVGDAKRLVLEAPAQEPAAVAPPRASRRHTIIAGGIATLTMLALATLAVIHFREKPPTAPAVVRFPVLFPEKSGRVAHLRVSPDGRWVVFNTGGERLWIHSLDSLDTRPLPGTENARGAPFFSPDSRTVVFGIPGKLRRMDVAGGPPQTLCDLSGELRGGFLTADNQIVFGTTAASGLQQVPASGGPVSPVTTADRGSHQDPVLLPDGRHFLYVRFGLEEGGGIFLGSLDTKAEAQTSKRLLADVSPAAYARRASGDGGFVLFVRDATLMAQPFDDRALVFTGDAIPIAAQVSSNSGQFSVSSTGTLVHATAGAAGGRQLIWYDRDGKPGDTAWTPALYVGLALSPDASQVAVERMQQPMETWIFGFSRGSSLRLTPGGGNQPVWSPDGSRIAYSSVSKGGLVVKAASGAGSEDLLLKASRAIQAEDWSHDGRFLLYEDQDPKTQGDLWTLPTAVGAPDVKPTVFLNSGFNETDGRFSPDARFVAYVSDESGRPEVYVSPFPDARSGKWPISSGGGYQPRWRRDGKELLYYALGGRLMSVDVSLSPTFKASAPKLLFQAPMYNGLLTHHHYWDLTPDGKRFLINSMATDNSAPATVVLNWQAGLKK